MSFTPAYGSQGGSLQSWPPSSFLAVHSTQRLGLCGALVRSIPTRLRALTVRDAYLNPASEAVDLVGTPTLSWFWCLVPPDRTAIL